MPCSGARGVDEERVEAPAVSGAVAGLDVEAVVAAVGVAGGDDALGDDEVTDERARVAGALDLGDRAGVRVVRPCRGLAPSR